MKSNTPGIHNITSPWSTETTLDWMITIQAQCLNAIIIVGTMCNVVSFALFMHKPLRSRPFTVYHVALTVWDTVLLASAMVALIVDKLYDKALSQFISLISYTLMNCAMNSCILLTVAAMHERFIAVTKPMKRWGHKGMSRALITVTAISTIGCIYNAPKFFDLELVDFEDENNETVTGIQPSWFRNVWWYLLFYRCGGGLIFGSLIPMILISFMGGKVIASVRASASFRRMNQRGQRHISEDMGMATSRLDLQETTFITHQQPEIEEEKPCLREPNAAPVETIIPGSKQEKRVAKMIFVHGAKFTIAYMWPTLADAIELYIMILGDHIIPYWFNYLVMVGNFFVVLNSASNILLYICFCSAYRKSIRLIWRRLVSCC